MTTSAVQLTEEPILISSFTSRQDNRPKLQRTTWPALVKSLTRHLRLVDKHAARLWSPARFRRSAVRRKDTVQDVGVLAFDIDDGTDLASIEFWLDDLCYVIASSYSHTPEHPRLRVVIRLAAPIPVNEFESVWRRANQHVMHGHVDPSTKDASRIYYAPSCPPSADPVVVVHPGQPLDWQALPPLPPPKALPRRIASMATDGNDDQKRATVFLAKWERELADMPANSGRHNRLLELARAAGGLVVSGLLVDQDVVDAFSAAARANGLENDDGEVSVRRAISDGMEHGRLAPWVPDDLPDSLTWIASRRFQRTTRGLVDTDTGEVINITPSSAPPLIAVNVELDIQRLGELLWVDHGGLRYELTEYEALRRTFRLRVLQDGNLVHLDRLELGSARARAITLRAFPREQRAAIDRLLQRIADEHHAELERIESELEPVLVTLSNVQAEPVHWLWPKRIARKKLTVLEGDPGLGKSMIGLDLAARLSTGAALPDGEPNPFEETSVATVLLSAEDDPADTIRPRIQAAGGNPSLLTLLRGVQAPNGERVPNLADVEALRRAVLQTHAKLVIVDPLSAYVPATSNSWKDDEVRRLLLPIVLLAAELDFGLLLVRHLTKSNRAPAIYRGQASIGIGGAARAVFVVAKAPGDPRGQRRVLATVKFNAGAEPPPLGYQILAEYDQAAHVRWDKPGTVQMSADELLSPHLETEDEERSDRAVKEAEDVLLEILRDGPVESAGSEGVYAQARRAGVSKRTLERAKRNLGVKAKPERDGGKWRWYPPKHTQDNFDVGGEGEPGELGELTTKNELLAGASPQPVGGVGGVDLPW